MGYSRPGRGNGADRVAPVRRWWIAPVLAAVVAGLGGCSFVQGIFAESIGVPVASKAVAYKYGSQELIATDGTYCFVSRGTFERVAVGDHVQCAWSSEPPPDQPR